MIDESFGPYTQIEGPSDKSFTVHDRMDSIESIIWQQGICMEKEKDLSGCSRCPPVHLSCPSGRSGEGPDLWVPYFFDCTLLRVSIHNDDFVTLIRPLPMDMGNQGIYPMGLE